MKRIIASLVVVALAAAFGCAFVSAAETSGTQTTDVNVAQGKSYTTTTAAYGEGENAYYQDKAGTKLTDGVIGDKTPWSADVFVKLAKPSEGTDAFSSVVIDLEKTYTLARFSVNYYAGENGGVYYPLDVKVYTSDDKQTWTPVSGTLAGLGETADGGLGTKPEGEYFGEAVFDPSVDARGRYVKVELYPSQREGGAYNDIYVSEIRAFGSLAGDDESSAASSETSPPSTADRGVCAAAVLALVAVTGAAALIGKRV